MVSEAREMHLMKRAIAALENAGVPTMPRDEASAYLTSVITSAFEVLRAVESDTYIRGLLRGALEDLANPPTFQIRKPS